MMTWKGELNQILDTNTVQEAILKQAEGKPWEVPYCLEGPTVPRSPVSYCLSWNTRNHELRGMHIRVHQSILKVFNDPSCMASTVLGGHTTQSNTAVCTSWIQAIHATLAECHAWHFYAIKNLCTSTHLCLVLLSYSLRPAERQSHFLRDPLQMAQLLVFFCYDHQVLLL